MIEPLPWLRLPKGLGPILLGPVLLAVYALLGQSITPAVAILAHLRVDVLVLAGMGTLLLLPSWERLPGLQAGGRRRGLLAVAGALLGATLVAPWVSFPWIAVPTLVIAWKGRRLRPAAKRRSATLGVVALAAFLNMAAISFFDARGLRISPEEFDAQGFRVSTLLPDVPVHDAWAVELPGRGPVTLSDLKQVFRPSASRMGTPAILGLGAIREILYRALAWGDPRWAPEEASFLRLLTEEDRSRSSTEPGLRLGIWTVLYAFSEEGAVETLNGTAQVAVSCGVDDSGSVPRLILAFHVREVNWTTRYYMALIDPFRRTVIYPSLLRQFAHTWERTME